MVLFEVLQNVRIDIKEFCAKKASFDSLAVIS